MADQGTSTNCAGLSWALAVLGGAVVGVVLFFAVGWGFAPAAVLAVVLSLVVGLFLTLVVCPGRNRAVTPESPVGAVTPESPVASTSAPETAASAMAVPAASPALAEATVADQASQAPVSDPMVAPESDKPTAETMEEGRVTPAVQDEPAEEPNAAKTSAEVASAPEPSVDTEPAVNPAPTDATPGPELGQEPGPELMDRPRGGDADDLKKIGGIGPKLEQSLNDMGIWHYSQIAAWGPGDIAWVDQRLTFRGRIERDDWVGQAMALEQARN